MFSGKASDVEAYLSACEADVPDLIPGARKRVHWAEEAGAVTPVSVVYIHGFSATSQEIRPVPDQVAASLGANLHYTRLAGHGRNGPAMAEATLADWRADTTEALSIARAIGQRVLVISCSTGGTLVTDALMRDANAIVGAVFAAPNFGLASGAARSVLNMPGVRAWGPWVLGQNRSFAPISKDHEYWWTTRYPTRAVFTMQDAVQAVWAQDPGRIATPALLIKSAADRVVLSSLSDRYFARWGGPVTAVETAMGQDDDANAHVIAGDIFSPGKTAWTVERILSWFEGL